MECQDQSLQTLNLIDPIDKKKEDCRRSLSQEFACLISSSVKEENTLGDIAGLLGKKGFALLNIFLALPFLQPIPLPVLSTVFGLIIAINGFVMIFSDEIWLPQKIRQRKIPEETIIKISTVAIKIFSKVEKLVKPRMRFVSRSWFKWLNGLIISVCGLSIIPPLPIPATNLIPGLIVILLSMGLLEEDGLIITLAYSIFISSSILVFAVFPHLIHYFIGL